MHAVYHARPETERRLVAQTLGAFPTCPLPEVARMSRTLRRWRSVILANLPRHR
ncbi:hypothetical protein GMA12_18040 [Kocuria sediminis]|uniref:Uncharacterized protein n=1 Tax=Kocuria sediminis TaxID=1038857 RepID=A0A6N8GRW4_9MICC|nr:hypothetical protein [Kocuria sediminis]